MLVFLIILILLLAGFVALCNFYVSYSAKGKIFHNLDELPFYPVGLVLGTSSKRDNGEPNQYFVNRLDAAVELLRRKKISRVILSGGVTIDGENEPRDMHRYMLQKGVAEDLMEEDCSGWRTLESIKNAKDGGVTRMTIITQGDHAERALFLAQKMKMDCVAFAAQDVHNDKTLKVKLHEVLAKVKACIDVVGLKVD